MPSALPASVKHLVVGAGVHGLSTAWHLAKAGEDVLVVDKTGVAAGASGIACGVVRNNYFQPAMAELMAACVEIWESDPEALHYHGSGYVALGPPAQEPDLVEVFERQQRIGYPSELHRRRGGRCASTCARSTPTGARQGLTVCLHEHAGGFAFNRESMLGLADKARAAGAQIVEGVEVTGFDSDGSGAVTRCRRARATSPSSRSSSPSARGSPRCGRCSACPRRSTSRRPTARSRDDRAMWTYWYLQEGEVAVDPATFATADGDAVAGAARRQRRRAARRRRPAAQRRAVGHLRQARPRVASRAAPRRSRWARVRGRPVPDRHRRPRLPRQVVRGAVALPRALRGRAARSTARCARAASARSPPTTSRSSTTCARTSTSSRTPTTATR